MLSQGKKIKSFVGQLNYLVQNTRLELCFAVISLGRKFVKATNRDLKHLRTEMVRIKEEECKVVIIMLDNKAGYQFRFLRNPHSGMWKREERR